MKEKCDCFEEDLKKISFNFLESKMEMAMAMDLAMALALAADKY